MAFLYRYTCKPNYPVCTAGIIFHSQYPNEEFYSETLIKEARKLALEEGCVNAGEDENLYYFGTFEPTNEYCFEPVLVCHTGEY